MHINLNVSFVYKNDRRWEASGYKSNAQMLVAEKEVKAEKKAKQRRDKLKVTIFQDGETTIITISTTLICYILLQCLIRVIHWFDSS